MTTANPGQAVNARASRAEEMRGRLINATINCIVEDGYASTSTNTIIRRAGVTRGALTHHFPSKALLMLAVVDRAHEAFRHTRRELVKTMSGSPQQRMRALLEAAAEANLTPVMISYFEIVLAERADSEISVTLRAYLRRQHRAALNEIGRLLGIEDPENNDDLQTAVSIGMSYLRGVIATTLIQDEIRDWTAEAGHLADALSGWLEGRSKP